MEGILGNTEILSFMQVERDLRQIQQRSIKRPARGESLWKTWNGGQSGPGEDFSGY